jgi:hypothetical protein
MPLQGKRKDHGRDHRVTARFFLPHATRLLSPNNMDTFNEIYQGGIDGGAGGRWRRRVAGVAGEGIWPRGNESVWFGGWRRSPFKIFTPFTLKKVGRGRTMDERDVQIENTDLYARGPQCLDNVTVWELARHIR